MRNYFKNKLKERLTYCQDWKHSIDMYLANREITKKADEEYYKTRLLLKLMLDIYFSIHQKSLPFLKEVRCGVQRSDLSEKIIILN